MSYPSLSRAVEGFILNISAAGRSEHTIRNYRTALNRFVQHLDNVEINQVTPEDIDEYMAWLKSDFRITHVMTTPITPRKLSKKSLSNIHGNLSVFWKWVSKEFRLPNPFKVQKIKYYPKPISPLTQEEIESLLEACRYTHKTPKSMKSYSSQRRTFKRDKAIILTFLDTGMRVSELCGIQIKDFLPDNGRIIITGKGSKTRFVYLGKVSLKALWSYLLERFPNQSPPKEDYLFTDQYDMYALTRDSAYKLIKRLGQAAGVSDVYPHKFRHTFAVQFLRNGGNVFELQQLLGHSDLAMAKKYVRLAQIDLETSAKRASPADCWRLR
jgi:integrase/recombinase XerD